MSGADDIDRWCGLFQMTPFELTHAADSVGMNPVRRYRATSLRQGA
jgi:hypothetical protein